MPRLLIAIIGYVIDYFVSDSEVKPKGSVSKKAAKKAIKQDRKSNSNISVHTSDQIDKLLTALIKAEGGFQDSPSDKGNYYRGKLLGTKYGITPKVLANWRKKTVTKTDMRQLQLEEALEIYKSQYYFKPKINLLPDFIEPVVFDWGVNSGPRTSIKYLQKVLNAKGYGPLKVDGKIGAKTVAASQIAFAKIGPRFVNDLCAARDSFYRRIVFNDSTQQKFLKGWLNRSAKFRVV